MLAVVAASPANAFATSAAADTHGTFLHGPVFPPTRGFCKLTTMLPIVAFAVPVLVTVTTPLTVIRLLPVAPFAASTVHVMVCVPAPAGTLCVSGFLSSVQAVFVSL